MKLPLLVPLLLSSAALAGQNKPSVARDSLQGAWECIYSVYDTPGLAHDEPAPYGLDSPDLIWFENDSLFEFNYPCYMNAAYRIKISGDTLFDISEQENDVTGPSRMLSAVGVFPSTLTLRNDTLIRMTGEYGKQYTEKRYVRTQVDAAQIVLLKKNRVDPKCLQGKWKLQTTYDSGYDGNGEVNYDFPFAPQYVMIFGAHSRSNYSNNTLWLKADGVAKPFSIVELSSGGSFLELQTESWYKGFGPCTLHYYKVE